MAEDMKNTPEGTEDEFDPTKIEFKDIDEAKKKYYNVHKDLQKVKSKAAEEKIALETELNSYKEKETQIKEAEKKKKEDEMLKNKEYDSLLTEKDNAYKTLEQEKKTLESELKTYKKHYEAHKNKLLDKLPSSDREVFKDLNAEQLEIVLSKLETKTDSTQQPPKTPAGLADEDFKKLSPDQQRIYLINHAQPKK